MRPWFDSNAKLRRTSILKKKLYRNKKLEVEMESSWCEAVLGGKKKKQKTCLFNSLFVRIVSTCRQDWMKGFPDKLCGQTAAYEAKNWRGRNWSSLQNDRSPLKKVPEAKKSSNCGRGSFSAAHFLITFTFAFEKVVALLSSLLRDISLLQIHSMFEINSLNDSYLLVLQKS